MAQLPHAPKKSELEDAPFSVQNYIKRLLELAKNGLELKNAVTPEFKIGKIFKDADEELDIPVIITLKRGSKPARDYPINEFSIDGNGLIDKPVFTDSHGEYSYRYHTKGVNSLVINIGLQNFNDSDETELRYYQNVIEITAPKNKQPDKLKVIIPGADDDNVVTKSSSSSGFMITLQILMSNIPSKGMVNMISADYFQYFINNEVSVASRNHQIEVSNNLVLNLSPSKDWQKISFFIDGDEPQTFEFKSKT